MSAPHGGARERRDLTTLEVEVVRRMRGEGARWEDVALALGGSRDWARKASERAGLWERRVRVVAEVPVSERAGAGTDSRVDQGALPAMHPISLAVLREAGLPIRAPG